MADAILGRDAPAVARHPAQAGVETPERRCRMRADGGWTPGASPAVSREPRGIASSPGTCADLDVEIVATDGTREYLASEGRRVAACQRPDRGPPLVGGQVKTFHPAVYAGDPRTARHARAAGRARGAGDRPHRCRHGEREALRSRGRGRLVGLNEAIEMIDVGGAALLRRRGTAIPPALPPWPIRPITRRSSRRSASWGTRAPSSRPTCGRGLQHGRRLQRRDRRVPEPDRRQRLPDPARDRPREGRRPALRREPPPARRLLPRNDPPQRHLADAEPAAG